jgi:hypothetical protein
VVSCGTARTSASIAGGAASASEGSSSRNRCTGRLMDQPMPGPVKEAIPTTDGGDPGSYPLLK